MKKMLLFIACCFVQAGFAASSVWQIKSGKNTVYLSGTIHLLRSSDYPLPAAYEQAYSASSILAFETDIEKTREPAFQQQMLQTVLLPAPQKLEDFLQPGTLKQLNTHLSENKMGIQYFSRFRPVMVAITLTVLELEKLGINGEGVDNYFFHKARTDGKSTLALESLQQHLEYLSSMGQGQEDLMIQQTLNDINTLDSQFSAMIEFWRNGDTIRMQELFVDPMKDDFEPIYQQLLVERNNNWMPIITQMLKTTETEMVLVGAAHLLGEEGLIRQLRRSGYEITQLP